MNDNYRKLAYISGPIKSSPDDAAERFEQAEKQVSALGYRTVNPIHIGKNIEERIKRKPTEAEYLKWDISFLVECDIVFFIPGWDTPDSCAILEHEICQRCGIEIQYL